MNQTNTNSTIFKLDLVRPGVDVSTALREYELELSTG